MKRIQSHTNVWLKRKTLKSSKRRPCRSSDHNLRTIPSLRCEFPNRLLCCCLVAQLCSTLCNPMDCSMPGFPVLCYLLEFAQIQIQWISDAIQPSYPLSSPSPSAFNISQHLCLFQWVGSLYQVAKVLELQHQSFRLSSSSSTTSVCWILGYHCPFCTELKTHFFRWTFIREIKS